VPITPKRAGRTARPGSRFLSDALAANVRDLRSLRRFSQDDLAERMRAVGHEWSRATVSTVERGQRNVTVDELATLALVLGVTFGDLLDPTGADRRGREGLDYAPGVEPLPALTGSGWAHGTTLLTLKWNDGPSGISVEPAPAPPHLHSRAAMAALEQTGVPVRYAPGDNDEGQASGEQP
jgi:transcriptional regulator with XRE-family HTH domain